MTIIQTMLNGTAKNNAEIINITLMMSKSRLWWLSVILDLGS